MNSGWRHRQIVTPKIISVTICNLKSELVYANSEFRVHFGRYEIANKSLHVHQKSMLQTNHFRSTSRLAMYYFFFFFLLPNEREK